MSHRFSTPHRRPGSGAKQSPGSLSRLQEKEDLQQLNDRLAVCIERNLSLEKEKQTLLQQLANSQEESSDSRSRYETKLADTRKALDRAVSERDRLRIELDSVNEEHRNLQGRNTKTESELKSSLARVRDLESSLNSKEAEVATYLSEKRSLEKELSEAQVHLAKVNSIANEAKTQLQDEKLQRCDLANRLQTLQEKLDFEKNLHAKEIMEIKKHENRLREVESGSQLECENKLAEALEQLRGNQREEIKEFKEKLERNFQTKLENAQLAAAKSSDLASAAKEEVETAKRKVNTLTSELQQYRNQSSDLQTKVQDLEIMLDREKTASQRQMADKEQENEEIREKNLELQEKCNDLLEGKLALDMEINAYSKMLEGEEQRLDLTPSPNSRSSGKKRKLPTPEHARLSGSPVFSTGKIIFGEVDNEGKFVKVKNISNEDQPIGGCTIRRRFEDSSEIRYKFPARYILKAKQEVTVWAASSNGAQSAPANLVSKNLKSWGTGDVQVVLLDARGKEMAAQTIMEIPGSPTGDEDGDGPSELTRRRIQYTPMSHAENEDPSCTLMLQLKPQMVRAESFSR